MEPINLLPIGTFITAKKRFQRGQGTALTHGNVYRIVGYDEDNAYYYIVAFIRSIREERNGINIKGQPRCQRFKFPTWSIKPAHMESLFDQNDIEYFIYK